MPKKSTAQITSEAGVFPLENLRWLVQQAVDMDDDALVEVTEDSDRETVLTVGLADRKPEVEAMDMLHYPPGARGSRGHQRDGDPSEGHNGGASH